MKTSTAYYICFLYFAAAILLNIILFDAVYAFSTYGSPSEFGNASDTTCFLGGDFGILNCTGNVTGSYFHGNGSQLTGITTVIAQDLNCNNCLGTPQIADIYLQLTGGTMIGNILNTIYNITAKRFFGNGSNLTNVNASSVNCDDIYFSGTQGAASICDGDDAFGGGGGGNGAGKWVDIGSWLVPNETFAVNVNVTGDLKIQGSGDFTCSACINPADINDVDKEDIENDLNTFVDIGGDNMTGDLVILGRINATDWSNVTITETQVNDLSHYATSDFITDYENQAYAKKANLTIWYVNLDTDSTNDVTSVSGAVPIASTGGTTPTISITQSGSGSNGYLSSTDWNTFNNKIDSGDAIDDIAEWDSLCTDCVGTDDVATGACNNNCLIASPTFTSPIIDTTLFPDSAGGATLGSAATEWGDIYILDNKKIYLGTGSDAQIYFDGSRLVIKVTS